MLILNNIVHVILVRLALLINKIVNVILFFIVSEMNSRIYAFLLLILFPVQVCIRFVNIRFIFIYFLLMHCYFCSVLKKSTYMICNFVHVYLNKSCVEVQTNTVQKLSKVYNSWKTVQVRKKSGRTPPVSRIVANRRGGKIVLLLKNFFTTVLSTHT